MSIPVNDNAISKVAMDRFVDSQPILSMLEALSNAGYEHFDEDGVWEICLCALVLSIDPKCKFQRILESLPYHTAPLDEADLLNTMAHLGYFCQQYDADIEDIDARLLPGLFIPHDGEPCIILGRDRDNNLRFYDPVSKLISLAPPSFNQLGKTWFFQRYDENCTATSKFMRQGSGHSWFRALFGRFKGTFAQVMTAGLILNIIALSTPLFIMLVYDRVIAAGALDTLPMLVLGATIAIAFEWKLRKIRSTGLSWLAGRLDNIVGNKIFSHLIGLPPSLIETASVAAQIARIKTFESVRDFFSGSVFLSLLEAPFVIIAMIALAAVAGPLVFIPLSMMFGYITLFLIMRYKIKIAIRIAAKTSSIRQQFIIETFEKLEGIHSQGLSTKWQEKFRHLSGREMMAHFHLSWLGMIAENIAHALTIITAVATVGFGVQMIWDGIISTGALVAGMILVWRILTPFYSLCTMIPRLEQLRNSVAQVNKLIDIDTEAEEAKSFSRLPKLKGAISFHKVSFRYSEDADDVFSDLNFNAKPGDIVVITGNNGTGKASVLKLIQSLYPATNGMIRIDGFDIRQLDAPDLRCQMAYVPKTPYFFHGTIIENLRFAGSMAKEQDIRNALELADAWDDVQSLPNGLHTIIGAHSSTKTNSNLATRLSLARAYLHPAAVLLIDELPNTLLSGKTGENLKNYLIREKGKRTIILCGYREDFMKLADTIILLQGIEAPIVGERDKMLNILNFKGNKVIRSPFGEVA